MRKTMQDMLDEDLRTIAFMEDQLASMTCTGDAAPAYKEAIHRTSSACADLRMLAMQRHGISADVLRSRIEPLRRVSDKPSFEREQRYIVVKIKDLDAALYEDQRDLFNRLVSTIRINRKQRGKKELECVVVESDWPEYEPTWKAIERRVLGGEA